MCLQAPSEKMSGEKAIERVLDPLMAGACKRDPVAEWCGAPMQKRVLTLIGAGELCTANAVLNIGSTERFQSSVMQRTPIEAAANAAAAERFFAEQYGLDFAAAEWRNGVKTIDGAEMSGFQLNEQLQLRVYTLSSVANNGQQPLGSIKVWQGGWMARITRDGHTFGGAFGAAASAAGGRCYPIGTIVLFGDYRLQGFKEQQTTECRREGDIRVRTHVTPEGRPTTVAFSSRTPLIADVNEHLVFDHALVTETGERGVARAVLSMEPLEGGGGGAESEAVSVTTNEVWTFVRGGSV